MKNNKDRLVAFRLQWRSKMDSIEITPLDDPKKPLVTLALDKVKSQLVPALADLSDEEIKRLERVEKIEALSYYDIRHMLVDNNIRWGEWHKYGEAVDLVFKGERINPLIAGRFKRIIARWLEII